MYFIQIASLYTLLSPELFFYIVDCSTIKGHYVSAFRCKRPVFGLSEVRFLDY